MSDLIKTTFEKIKVLAKKDDAQVELLITGGEKLSLSYQKKKLDKFDSSQSQMAGFRVLANSCQGYSFTENLSEESLLQAYKEALQNAKMLAKLGGEQKTRIEMIQNQNLVDEMNDLNINQDIEMNLKHQIAKDLESKTLAMDSRITAVPYSGFSEAKSWKRVLNTNGVDKAFRQSYFVGYAYPLAKEGESSKMSGEGVFVREFGSLHVDHLIQAAVAKTLSLLGAQKLASGQYPVVIDREVAAKLMHLLLNYFSAQKVDEGRSILKGKLNQQVASTLLTMKDDPFERKGTAVRPFDDEGTPSQKVTLIEKGMLKQFLTNSEYAQKMNLPLTAHASRSPAGEMGISCSNVIVEKGTDSLEQLLKKHKQVIYLTELTGGLHSGFKEASGDFSLPGEGFLYVDGVRKGPVDQFVFSGNILEMMSRIEAVGNEYNRPGDQVMIPDLLISEMSFA